MAILKLENEIMDYAWGSCEDIAALQGRPVPSPGPEAELWMGAHPKAPSLVQGRSLANVINDDPVACLGSATATTFNGRLPFLLKLLAAAQPLSLQTHPNLDQAKAGFLRENAAGIPLDAPHRNFRDDNHKPEVVCALGEFWALNGFREREEFLGLIELAGLNEISAEIDAFRSSDGPQALSTLFTSLMSLDPARVLRLNQALRNAADGPLSHLDEGVWLQRIHDSYPEDPGVISVLLLNLVKLTRGQAMPCSAGYLHAYLSGFCVELMANSDNVLRGGLTPKHVDLDELTAALSFKAGPPMILEPQAGVYATPVNEFGLTAVNARPDTTWISPETHGFEILVAVAGSGHIGNIPLRAGEAVAITADEGSYQVTGHLDLFKAEADPTNA